MPDIIRSYEFQLGYNACDQNITRNRNPYAAGQPWLAEFPDKKILRQMNDWTEGWNKRFYGEELYSEP